MRPGRFAAHSLGIVTGGDTEAGGGVDTDAVEAHQTGSSRGDELAENDREPGELLGGRPDES
jgi:hypothetical protein